MPFRCKSNILLLKKRRKTSNNNNIFTSTMPGMFSYPQANLVFRPKPANPNHEKIGYKLKKIIRKTYLVFHGKYTFLAEFFLGWDWPSGCDDRSVSMPLLYIFPLPDQIWCQHPLIAAAYLGILYIRFEKRLL